MTQTAQGLDGRRNGGPQRTVALVGPYSSGKTALLESVLFAVGAIARRGSHRERSTVGDASPEARKRGMGIELNVASFDYLGDSWTFLDCPGSIELQQDAVNALMVADAAVVVCEPLADRVTALAPTLKFLEDRHIPHVVFLNKMDAAHERVRDVLNALQAISSRKLVLRQVPIRKTDKDGVEEIAGYVDLVSERAYRYKPGEASDLIELPSDVLPREAEARREMLESLADFDDALLEQLIEDKTPEKTHIYKDLHAEFAADQIVPVLLGAGEKEHGVRRLLKALRHDTPYLDTTAARRGLKPSAVQAECFKVVHLPHAGKLAYVRLWNGALAENQSVASIRVGSLLRAVGSQTTKVARAKAGDVVAIAKLDALGVGQTLTDSGIVASADWPQPMAPVHTLAVVARNRAEEVKLSGALHKLAEEDPSLSSLHSPDTGELLLRGQGDIQLKLAVERLAGRFNVAVDAQNPAVAYKESFRKSSTQHARFKRQTGGHGQFADIKVDIKPLPRGSGIRFSDRVVGGAVPRQYIPAVEAGVREWAQKGPLGHPVVDFAVELFDGGFHTVDSSEAAFKQAARIAMSEAMAVCEPVLLEPILKVAIAAPNEATARVQRIISGRRGHILGYDARDGWPGWDETTALIPEADLAGLIVDIRSATQGVGTYTATFDHLQELHGRDAEKALGRGSEKTSAAAS